MNNRDSPLDALLDSARGALSDLGFEMAIDSSRSNADHVVLTIARDGKSYRYHAEVKRSIRPGVLGPIVSGRSRRDEEALLITDYVSPPHADELRHRDIQFVDAAGNAFLKRRNLLVIVSGHRPRVRSAGPKTLRVFRPSGIRALFALLSVPDLIQAPQREIAKAAGIALGSVAAVFDGLRELGFLAEINGKRQLVRRDRLIEQWTEAYARLLDPTLNLGRFAEPAPNWWRQVDPVKYGAQWGGETAAAVLQRSLVPESTIIYSDQLPSRLLTKYRLRSEPDGRVVVRRRFWNFQLDRPRGDLVPPLLIYADLAVAGDARSLAAAEQIREKYLV